MSRVRLSRPDGRRVWRYRLVMEEFLERELLPTELVHHKNEDFRDDRLENLVLVSRGEHASIHHKGKRRPTHPWTKITEEQVFAIRQYYRAGGVTKTEVATHFGVSPAYVSLVTRNKRRSEGT